MGGRTGLSIAPSAIIGLGTWGRLVARGVEAALRERSPDLCRACPVLLLEEEEPAIPDLIRAHLKASRMAEVIRALERAGLMQLDPMLPPPTYVYLVASQADDPGLARLRAVAEQVGRVAGELKVTVVRVAFIDLGESVGFGGAGGGAGAPGAAGRAGGPGAPDDRPLPFPLYLMEPTTCHGLVLDPAEYLAAATEALVAAVQPGGSQIFASGRAGGGVGTLGIAWMRWRPGDLLDDLSRRLSREAVRALLTPPATPAGSTLLPAAPTPPGSVTAGRLAEVLAGLPFRPGPGEAAAPVGGLVPTGSLFGDLSRRRCFARHLRRCLATLPRRRERWERLLQANSVRRAEAEGALLAHSVTDALAAGPDGLWRAQALLHGLADEAVDRLETAAPPDPLPPAGEAIRRLGRAEEQPDVRAVALGFLLFAAVMTLVGRPLGAGWSLLLPWWGALAAIGLVYSLWRPRQIRRRREAAVAALNERAAALAEGAAEQALADLDRLQEARCRRQAEELLRHAKALRERCAPLPPGDTGGRGALSAPFLDDAAMAPLYARQQLLLPDLAAHLAAKGCLTLLADPEQLLARAEGLTQSFLAERLTPDPGQVASQAYGSRLGERLQEVLGQLLAWSGPLLAAGALPDPADVQRWLLWPAGLPCPPVPPGIQLLSGSQSGVVALTVVPSLPGQAGRLAESARALGLA